MTYLFLCTLSNTSVHHFPINPSTQSHSIIIIIKTENNLLVDTSNRLNDNIRPFKKKNKKKNSKLTMTLCINA
jgi:hypothetical protein